MSQLSKRAIEIKPSPTLAMLARAKELAKKGIDVCDFSVGEPDFDTPQNVKDAASRAMAQGFTKYTAAAGIIELRQAIAEKLKKENHIDATANEVVVSNGAKQAVDSVFRALCNPGDEVLLPAPFWPSFFEMAKLSGATPKIIPADNGLKVSAESIRKNIGKNTKLFILNSPNNPTGSVYTKNEIKGIADVLLEHKLMALSDEIYENFSYEGRQPSLASLSDELLPLVVTVNGFSKTYAMTGWRVGYCHAQSNVANAVASIQGNSVGNANSIAQKAALEAITNSKGFVEKMVLEFSKRRELIFKELNKINGFSCEKPAGAFFAFPDVSVAMKEKKMDSTAFSMYLLDALGVASVSGKDFGMDGHLRFSFATSAETISRGLEKLSAHFE